jgi:hypothetical protein
MRSFLRSEPAREFYYQARSDLVDDLLPTVLQFVEVLNKLAETGDFESAAHRYFESEVVADSGSTSGLGLTPIGKAHFAWTATGREPESVL